VAAFEGKYGSTGQMVPEDFELCSFCVCRAGGLASFSEETWRQVGSHHSHDTAAERMGHQECWLALGIEFFQNPMTL
jgi:hypothetical protein